ncbi:MAG: redox-sensing transcriptional repressor Rex [Bacteroidota bacterium]
MKKSEPDNEIPAKTIERLSQYRRLLITFAGDDKKNIYSHELAKIMNLTPVQVRRDLMLIGYSGSQNKGYLINNLIELIGSIIDSKEGEKIIIIGMGNLGRAITSYFLGKREKLNIVAAFDNDSYKTNRVISGVKCYDISRLKEIINKENVSIAVLTVAPEAAENTCKLLVNTNIKGILNYTTIPLKVPESIHLEEYDMITSMEKLAYFVKE